MGHFFVFCVIIKSHSLKGFRGDAMFRLSIHIKHQYQALDNILNEMKTKIFHKIPRPTVKEDTYCGCLSSLSNRNRRNTAFLNTGLDLIEGSQSNIKLLCCSKFHHIQTVHDLQSMIEQNIRNIVEAVNNTDYSRYMDSLQESLSRVEMMEAPAVFRSFGIDKSDDISTVVSSTFAEDSLTYDTMQNLSVSHESSVDAEQFQKMQKDLSDLKKLVLTLV